jgi:hypothetical protein
LAGFGNRAMLPSKFSRVVVRGLDAAQVKKIVGMQSKIRMHRRDVLKGLSASLGLAGALVCSAAWTEVTASGGVGLVEIRRHIRRALTGIFNEDLTPRTIGRGYLSLYPEEADVDWLWTTLAGSSAPSRADELTVRVAQLRQRDFECGEIAIVDGWILARTEARACALLALI